MTPNDERAQIRAEAVRECIAALPASNFTIATWDKVLIGVETGRRQCREALIDLLRPDPAAPPLEPWHAGVTLNDKNEWVQPSPAAAHGEAGTLHEPTVRACIDGLTKMDCLGNIFAIKHLRTLLPKPDPAKELVEEYEAWAALAPRRQYTNAVFRTRLDTFARWLHDTGRLKA